MSFDMEKLQAVAELGEVIRLQNEALERLQAFRNARPYLIVPNLAKMVEENLKENVHVLYKELNNLHRPPEKKVRYVCESCHLAFAVPLPGGLCDECRSRQTQTQPRAYGAVAPTVTEEATETVVENSAIEEEATELAITESEAIISSEQDQTESETAHNDENTAENQEEGVTVVAETEEAAESSETADSSDDNTDTASDKV